MRDTFSRVIHVPRVFAIPATRQNRDPGMRRSNTMELERTL